MAQVPQHQRARVVHDAGDLRHVRERAAAVGHVGEADQRGPGVHGGAHRIRGHAAVQAGADQAQFRAALGGDPGQHVTVRREVVVVGDDDRPAGTGGQRGPGQLVQVDRGGVTDQHLPGRGAQQAAPEQVPGPAGQADPVAPGPDKPGPPLAPQHIGDPVGRGERQHAERIPVQVDQRRIFQKEALTEAGQGIGRVAVEREGPAGPKAAAHRSTIGVFVRAVWSAGGQTRATPRRSTAGPCVLRGRRSLHQWHRAGPSPSSSEGSDVPKVRSVT